MAKSHNQLLQAARRRARVDQMAIERADLVNKTAAYVFALSALQYARDLLFPVGQVVKHRDANHWGIVVHTDEPPQKIAVLFENGNTWFKEPSDWEPCNLKALWPKWIKRVKRKDRGNG